MAFWMIIAAVTAALCVFFAIIAKREARKWDINSQEILFGLLAVCFGVVAFFSVVIPVTTRMEYKTFEYKLEIQRQQYETMIQSDTIDADNVYRIIDVVAWNDTLAELQARREYYGFVSVIPDRVMDIEPIGMK